MRMLWLLVIAGCSQSVAAPATKPKTNPVAAQLAVRAEDRICKADTDCTAILTQCSHTQGACTGVRIDRAKGYEGKLDCTNYRSPIGNYDCLPRFGSEEPRCISARCESVRKPEPEASQSQPLPLPPHLATPPELWTHRGKNIVRAPEADQRVAATYALSPVRGKLVDGGQITILTERTSYRVGERVRVIHVLEVPDPGQEVYVMGPEEIFGEEVDGVVTAQAGIVTVDGMVIESPAVNFNFEVTSYKFDKPGRHTIVWRMGKLTSNTIELDVR
jgi:hypothetical protein